MTSFNSAVSWESRFAGEDLKISLTTAQLLDARAHGTAKVIDYQYDEALTCISGLLESRFPDNTYCSENFDQISEINKRTGHLIEVGGPSEDYGYPVNGPSRIQATSGKQTVITNALKRDRVQALIDSNHLPFKDDNVGAIMARCLPNKAREFFFDEAYRTLEDGGLLLYSRGVDLDVYHSMSIGFEMKAYSREDGYFPGNPRIWHFILQKLQN